MAHSEVSASSSRATLDDAQQALADLRLSIDGEQNGNAPNGVTVNGVHGKPISSPSPRSSAEVVGMDRVAILQRDLDRSRQENEQLTGQYQSLVARVNSMRTTLGNKVKQDADELDRREQAIQQLTAQNEDMSSTIQALQDELIASNAEAERASKELETMRSRAFDEDSQEAAIRERELRELQIELERCRMERDEWEREALEGRVGLDEAKISLENVKRDLEIEREAGDRVQGELEWEREKSVNLQSVLEDFQQAKDHELRQAVRDREAQLAQVTQALAEYKHRAHTAEMQLEENSTNTTRTAELEKEVKEKGLLIGKLRHEGVIMNEHLMEALRRLRKNQTDNNVDRRLVTNVLLSFLTTPRADSKRFEMLSLLATILSWNDTEREKAGLQRTTPASSSSSSSLWGRSSSAASTPSKGKGTELDTSDETESFSQRWVEFLLKEASAGSDGGASSPPPPQSPGRSTNSLPGSPKPGASPRAQRPLRLASFTSAAMASSPNLNRNAPLSPPPPKGGQ